MRRRINFFYQFLYRNFLNTLLLHKTGKPRSQLTQYEDIGGLDTEDIDDVSFDIQDDTLLDESDYIEDIQEDTLLDESDVSDELIIDSGNTLDTGIEDESNDDTLVENVESEVSTEDVQEHLYEDDTAITHFCAKMYTRITGRETSTTSAHTRFQLLLNCP